MPNSRYTNAAIILHWIIALAIFCLLASGIIIDQEWLQQDAQFILFQWHKSLGVLALIAIVIRLLWRLTHRPPTISELSKREQQAAHMGHWLLYAALLSMPISGWLLVSASVTGIPTLVFNLFQWPHLPVTPSEDLSNLAHGWHYYSAWILALLAFGHIGMVIKHRLHQVNLLSRMPFASTAVISLAVTAATLALLAWQSLSSSSTPLVQTDTSQGEIRFTGNYSGKPFNGVFNEWQLSTDLDPASGRMTNFSLTVVTGSANTGNGYYDSTLKESDWFAIEQYPEARYQSTALEKLSDTQLQLTGDLTIKDHTQPLTLILDVVDPSTIATSFTLSRFDYKLGVGADPTADWVDEDIEVNATAKLTP